MSQQSDVFKAQVATLIERFEAVLAGTEWSTYKTMKRMRDEDRVVYEAPALSLGKHTTRLVLDPIGYGFGTAEAGVDLYLLPPYDRVAGFYLEGDAWFVYAPVPLFEEDAMERFEDWPRQQLTDESLRSVLEAIAEYAVPSV